MLDDREPVVVALRPRPSALPGGQPGMGCGVCLGLADVLVMEPGSRSPVALCAEVFGLWPGLTLAVFPCARRGIVIGVRDGSLVVLCFDRSTLPPGVLWTTACKAGRLLYGRWVDGRSMRELSSAHLAPDPDLSLRVHTGLWRRPRALV